VLRSGPNPPRSRFGAWVRYSWLLILYLGRTDRPATRRLARRHRPSILVSINSPPGTSILLVLCCLPACQKNPQFLLALASASRISPSIAPTKCARHPPCEERDRDPCSAQRPRCCSSQCWVSWVSGRPSELKVVAPARSSSHCYSQLRLPLQSNPQTGLSPPLINRPKQRPEA
jgi:hypothetical protein